VLGVKVGKAGVKSIAFHFTSYYSIICLARNTYITLSKILFALPIAAKKVSFQIIASR
jgi:hypothetical protein